jgi:hypothetical protein
VVRLRLLVGLIAAVVLCLGLGAAMRMPPDTAPSGDMALIDVHVLNVLRHVEPVGEYSRFGWRRFIPSAAIVTSASASPQRCSTSWPSGYAPSRLGTGPNAAGSCSPSSAFSALSSGHATA